jgi:hypothetical protein
MGMHPQHLKVTGVRRVGRSTVVICVASLVVGCVGGQGAADASPKARSPVSPTSVEPSLATSPIVRPLRDTGGDGLLDPGTYVLDQFPVDLAFDIPDGDPPGWHVGMSTPDAAIVLWFTKPTITYLFAFWNVDNVYVDPCRAMAGEVEPSIGPSVDDLVTALSHLPGFKATAPSHVAVGAFRGKEIELTALDPGADCPEAIVFSSGDGDTGVGAGETLTLQILDIGGVRIVMSRSRWVNTREPVERDPAAEAELQQILDSIRIQPPS